MNMKGTHAKEKSHLYLAKASKSLYGKFACAKANGVV